MRPLLLKDEDYRRVMERMLDDFNKGLGKDTNADAAVKMFTTYVRSVPDGTGKQQFIYFLNIYIYIFIYLLTPKQHD